MYQCSNLLVLSQHIVMYSIKLTTFNYYRHLNGTEIKNHSPFDIWSTLATFFIVVSSLESVFSSSFPNSSNILQKITENRIPVT